MQETSSPSVVYAPGAFFDPGAIIKDIVDGIRRPQVWLAFAWDETKQRYRRSVIGLTWILVSYLIFVAAITIFFEGFSSSERIDFVIYVAIGFAVFTFLAANVTDGCDVFMVAAPWIKSTTLPYSIYIFRSVARSVLPFVIQMCAAFAVMIAVGKPPGPEALMAAPALALLLINAIAIQIGFGLVSARFRDVSHLSNAIMRIMFFTTPIMWVYTETVGIMRQFADYNPMTHLIEVFRAPLMGVDPHPSAWALAILTTIVSSTLAIFLGALMRRRLPLWI